jgi:hypothetical protein
MRETIEAIRVLGFWRVAFYATLYRPLMRLAHRYHWHYAPPIHPERDEVLWCQWCGLRYLVPKIQLQPHLVPLRSQDNGSSPR